MFNIIMKLALGCFFKCVWYSNLSMRDPVMNIMCLFGKPCPVEVVG